MYLSLETTFGTVQKWSLRPLLDSSKGGLNIGILLYMCYISPKGIFARLLNAKMKIYVFENYMLIYTGRKMDENQGNVREEQREYCKIRGLLGKSASEIKSGSYFKEGRSSVKDEARPGRPVSVTSENNVATVQSIVQQD